MWFLPSMSIHRIGLPVSSAPLTETLPLNVAPSWYLSSSFIPSTLGSVNSANRSLGLVLKGAPAAGLSAAGLSAALAAGVSPPAADAAASSFFLQPENTSIDRVTINARRVMGWTPLGKDPAHHQDPCPRKCWRPRR